MSNPARLARQQIEGMWGSAIVHGRGRKWIRFEHPTDPRKKALVHHITPIHIEGTETEIDVAWQVNDNPSYTQYDYKMVLADYHAYVNTQAFDAANIIKYIHPGSGEEIDIIPYPSLVYTNDLDQIQEIGSVQSVPGVVGETRITWPGAYGPGLDFVWQTQTERLFKALDISQRSDLPDPEQYIIDGGNPVFRLELQFQKSAGIEIWVDGVLWDEKGNNPQRTANNVEFRQNGETLWVFRFPLAWDSGEGGVITPEMRLEKRANNLFVQIVVPWEWLNTATYPVTVDASVNPQVGASSDDAHEGVSTGGMGLTNVQLAFGDYNIPRHIGVRFTGVTIPDGVTIDTSYLQFFSSGPEAGTDFYTDFYAHDTQSPGTFTTTANDISGRTRTTASVAWDGPEDWGNNTWYNGPEIKTIIQELEDSYDYSSGDSMVLVNIYDSGALERRCDSYDGSTTDCPKIYIEYTEDAGAALTIQDIAHTHSLEGIGTLAYNASLTVVDIAHTHATEAVVLAYNANDC
jgi:hypothetical protein